MWRFQASQIPVGINERLLGNVFGIMEIMYFAIRQSMNSVFVFIHQYAEGIFISIEASLYQKIIF
jgi:hypothetical protein